MSSIAMLLLTTIAVYAGDDHNSDNNGHHYGKTDNPGHHYGQLLHTDAPPPTTQTPPPSTTQTPPQATTPAGAGHASGGSSAPDPAAPTNAGAADPPATVPVSNLQPAHVTAKTAPPSRDRLSWLVLLILPALLVVWLMVFARAALTAVRRRRVLQAA